MPAHAPLAQAKPQRAAPRKASRAQGRGTPLEQLQTKLQVGAAGDHYEREADRVAAQVMGGGSAALHGPAIPPTISPLGAQRKAGPRQEEEPRAGKPSARVQREVAAGVTVPPAAANAAAAPASMGAAGGSTTPAVADSIAALRAGSAAGLDGGTRSFMENRFGRDFTGVRVHDGPAAAAAASALGARAFTVGRDIFFNAGEYQPQTRSGRELLAHELTHTVQQGGDGERVARQRIQRDTSSDPAPVEFDIAALPGAKVSLQGAGSARGTIIVPTLGLPPVAGAHKGTAGGTVNPVAADTRSVPVLGNPLEFNHPMPRRDDDSVPAQVWTDAARADSQTQDGIKQKLRDKVAQTPGAASFAEAGVAVYYLKLAQAPANTVNVLVGTVDELAQSDALLRPQWSTAGAPLFDTNRFDADHFLEMQLGGADSGANMWLLKASYNRSVGSRIASNMRSDLTTIVNEAKAKTAIPADRRPQSVEEVRAHWNVRFLRVVAGSNFSGEVPTYWTREQVRSGLQVDGLRLMNEDDLIKAGLRPKPGVAPTQVRVFPSAAGGLAKTLKLNANGSTVRRPDGGELFKGIVFNSGTYHGEAPLDAADSDLLTLNVTVLKTREEEGEEVIERRTGDVTVKRSPRLGIAGYLSRASIVAAAGTTRFKSMSPLAFADLGITPEGVLAGSGTITSTKLLLPGLNVPLSLYGDRIGLNFPVPTDSLNLGPVTVTEAGLLLGVGARGFLIEGYAGFEVRTLGSGRLAATVSEAGPVLSGNFNLAMDFLNPATVQASYNFADDSFSAQATLGVQEGRIPGVESGTVTVGFTRESVSVNGTLNLGGPLRGTAVNVTYTPTDGLRIGADNIPLPLSNLPAVQNATLSIAASRPPGAEAWSFSGRGSATLAAPGATGTLDISYLDGAVLLHGVGTVERGPASGTLDFTATNRPIDELGRPIEGPLIDGINAWGRGTVTVRFGNVLTGTAGIEYTPDNRVILSGTIAMPPVYDVFPRRDFNRDIFTLSPPEFPIWGVSLGGVGVGIFAFVDARVFFESHVGPGQIRNAAVTATLDLDRPEDATVHGEGEFYVPAYAGLGLDVGGGLRARAAVAYVEGRVGLIGRLGVEAGAGAAVTFDWNRSDGLSLGVDLHAEATPKFQLSATASVTVGVDLLLTEIEKTWGPWERELGSFGPDMTLGVRLPVRWTEAGGLDLSLDNIEVTRPNLDAPALMTSVFERLAP